MPLFSSAVPLASSQPLPTMMDPSKFQIPDTRSLDDCLRYWNIGDEYKGIPLPLRDWPAKFKPSAYRSEAVKWGKIAKVVEEFQDFCDSDHQVFESRFPGLSSRYTKLVKAINSEREKRDDLVRRPKKRQRLVASRTVTEI